MGILSSCCYLGYNEKIGEKVRLEFYKDVMNYFKKIVEAALCTITNLASHKLSK